MSETNPNQPPSEQPPVSAPVPGVRLRPPGAAPSLPDESDQLHHADAPPSPQPTNPEPTAPSQPGAEKTRRRRAERNGSASEPNEPGSRSPGPSTTATSSTTSTDDAKEPGGPRPEPAPAFVEPLQLAADLTGLVLAAGEQANERFADGTPLFLASEQEAYGLARPAARIVSRHMPAGMGGPGNPDLADAVSAGIVLFRYALRQVRLYHALRRARAEGIPRDDDPDQPAPADPLLHPVA